MLTMRIILLIAILISTMIIRWRIMIIMHMFLIGIIMRTYTYYAY